MRLTKQWSMLRRSTVHPLSPEIFITQQGLEQPDIRLNLALFSAGATFNASGGPFQPEILYDALTFTLRPNGVGRFLSHCEL